MFLIERSCRETFKNVITRHLTPSEDGEPPTPSRLFSVISGYFRLFQNKRRQIHISPHQRNKLLYEDHVGKNQITANLADLR